MSRNFLDSRKSSNFAQTCILLSQYLKEKGSSSLRDLNLEASGRPETSTGTTLPLTDTDESGGQISAQHVNLVLKSAGMGSYNCSIQEDGINSTTTSSEAAVEPKTAPMTIFYAGLVLVFDDYSADKAKEVMLLASKGSTDVESSSMPSASNIPSSLLDETWQKETQPIGSDLPIARRASLRRFLEKRKDHSHRASARAPYQLHNPSSASTKEQFDLNL